MDALDGCKKRTNEDTVFKVLQVMESVRSENPDITEVVCERQVRASPLNQGIASALHGFWVASGVSKFTFMRPKDKFLHCTSFAASAETNLKKRAVLEVEHLLSRNQSADKNLLCVERAQSLFEPKITVRGRQKKDDLCDVILQIHSYVHSSSPGALPALPGSTGRRGRRKAARTRDLVDPAHGGVAQDEAQDGHCLGGADDPSAE